MSPGGPTNPIWTLVIESLSSFDECESDQYLSKVEKYNVKNYFSNFSSLLTYDTNGAVDYLDKLDTFGISYSIVEQDAGTILLENLQDRSFRAALNLAGWTPTGDPQAQAVEWYQMDYEYAQTPVSMRLFYEAYNFGAIRPVGFPTDAVSTGRTSLPKSSPSPIM